jgi:hypothetical protein
VQFVSAPGSTDTVLTTNLLPCFVQGTRIDTPGGPVAVEALSPGDLVLTTRGPRPVRWIGWRTLEPARHRDPGLAAPVCVRADALAAGQPRRDVLLSPDHALAIQDGLIPVRLLVNGATIHRPDWHGTVTYYHLELDEHAILLAEGMPAESYLDTGNRTVFENAGGALALHPDFGGGPRDAQGDAQRDAQRDAQGDAQAWRAGRSCAPFLDQPDQVEPVWRRLSERAAAMGFDLPAPALTSGPDLCLLRGRARVKPLMVQDGRHVFLLPSGGPVRLVSRAAIPHAQWPWIEDRRRLGVMVRRIVVRHGAAVDSIPLDHPSLSDGWWAPEWDGPSLTRWTDGAAALPLPAGGPVVLEVAFGQLAGYAEAEPAVPREPRRPGAAAA